MRSLNQPTLNQSISGTDQFELLIQKFNALTVQFEASEAKRRSLKARLKEVNQELELAQAAYADATCSHMETSAEAQNLKEKNEDLEDDLKYTQTKLHILEDDLTKTKEELETYAVDLGKSEQKLARRNDENRALQFENQNLKDENQTLRNEIDQLKIQLRSLPTSQPRRELTKEEQIKLAQEEIRLLNVELRRLGPEKYSQLYNAQNHQLFFNGQFQMPTMQQNQQEICSNSI